MAEKKNETPNATCIDYVRKEVGRSERTQELSTGTSNKKPRDRFLDGAIAYLYGGVRCKC